MVCDISCSIMHLSACTVGRRVIRSRVEGGAPVRCTAFSRSRYRREFKGNKLASGCLKATFLGTPAAVCCQPSRAHRPFRRIVMVSALFGGRGTQSSNGNLSGYELRGSPTIKLPNGNTIVGRDEDDSDIVVNKAAVSNKHCRFTVGPRGVTLTDLRSTNGTFVDGKQVKGSVSLSPGDKVTLGNVNFTFVEKKPPAPKAPVQGTTRGSVRAGTTRGTIRGGTTRGTTRGTSRGSLKAGSQVVQRDEDARKAQEMAAKQRLAEAEARKRAAAKAKAEKAKAAEEAKAAKQRAVEEKKRAAEEAKAAKQRAAEERQSAVERKRKAVARDKAERRQVAAQKKAERAGAAAARGSTLGGTFGALADTIRGKTESEDVEQEEDKPALFGGLFSKQEEEEEEKQKPALFGGLFSKQEIEEEVEVEEKPTLFGGLFSKQELKEEEAVKEEEEQAPSKGLGIPEAVSGSLAGLFSKKEEVMQSDKEEAGEEEEEEEEEEVMIAKDEDVSVEDAVEAAVDAEVAAARAIAANAAVAAAEAAAAANAAAVAAGLDPIYKGPQEQQPTQQQQQQQQTSSGGRLLKALLESAFVGVIIGVGLFVFLSWFFLFRY